MTVVDLFAGAGGWDLAARQLGIDPVGLEMDADACATRALHHMPTIRTDVAAYPAERFAGIDGLIASPPCQDWSAAGSGAQLDGEGGRLVYEVPRWVEATRPRWVACEQVPMVLSMWRFFAHQFEVLGYRCWVGILEAERFGVPQTRERAILLAHRDRQPQPPTPTHQRYVFGEPARYESASMFHGEVLPWVSAAEACGWDDDRGLALPHPRGAGMTERHGERPDRPASEPSMAVTSKGRSWEWVIRTNNDSAQEGGRKKRYERDANAPSPTVTGSSRVWTHDRPATTIACDSRLFAPGGHHTPGAQSENAIRLHIDEGKVFQSFPADFAMHGSNTSQWQQIGNAIPPLLAERVLETVA